MNPRLIRAAIAFYPRDWRQRYGGELEELILEACSASASRVKAIWVIVGVAACGIRERVPRPIAGNAKRIGSTVAAAGLAAVAVVALSGGFQGGAVAPSAPPTPITLAPDMHLGAAVRTTSSGSLKEPRRATRTLVRVDPRSGDVVAVTGQPSRVVINPSTKQLIAVTRVSR